MEYNDKLYIIESFNSSSMNSNVTGMGVDDEAAVKKRSEYSSLVKVSAPPWEHPKGALKAAVRLGGQVLLSKINKMEHPKGVLRAAVR